MIETNISDLKDDVWLHMIEPDISARIIDLKDNDWNQAGKKPEIAREPGQIIFKIVREILKTVREHLSAGPKGRFSLRPEARIFLIFEPL